MLQSCFNSSFQGETPPRVAGSVPIVHNFDGHFTVESGVAGFPHLSHAAFAERRNDFVVVERAGHLCLPDLRQPGNLRYTSNFHRADSSSWNSRSNLDRLLNIPDFDEKVTADLLSRLPPDLARRIGVDNAARLYRV